MTKALNYSSNILTGKLNSVKDVLWDKVIYCNPNNVHNIHEKILWLKKQKNDYSSIFSQNTIENTYEDLKNIIKSV
jgi:hypothetical protein